MNRARVFFSILAAIGLSLGAQAATKLSADAGEVREIRWATGGTLYAATQGGGVYKSTDSGASWTVTGLNTGYVWRLAVAITATSTVYAATDAGLFKTVNGGTNWTQLTSDPARAVALDPVNTNGDFVLLGVTGQGIYRSTDGGTTFTRTSGGLNSADVTQIVFQSSSTAYAALDCNYQDLLGSFGEGGWGGIFKTTDGGNNWTSFNNGGGGGPVLGTPPNCVRAIATNATTVYAGTYAPFGAAGGGIYRSTGAGWASPGAGAGQGNLVGVEALAVDRNASTTIWGGSRQIGPYNSLDSGVNWNPKVTDLANDREALTRTYSIETIPGQATTALIAAKGIGIQRTTNGGTSWSIATGLKADRVRGLANHASAAPANYWMALENGGVKLSTNSGTSWSGFFRGWDCAACDVNVDARTIAADPSSTANGSVLVGVRGDGLWRFTFNIATPGHPSFNQLGWDGEGGLLTSATWHAGADNKPQSIIMPAANQIYATFFDGTSSGAGGLVRSTTGSTGLTQTVYPDSIVSCGTPGSAAPGAFKAVQASGGVAYLIRYDGPPYRSVNNFTVNNAGCVNAPHIGFSRLAFFDLAEKPTSTNILVGVTNKGVYRSTDTGSNWSRVDITGPAGMPSVLAAVAYVGSNVYAISRAGGFYCSANDGTTWQAVSLGGSPAVPFRDMKVMNGAIHILTDGGGVYTGFAATCP